MSGRQLLKEGDMNAAADKVARAQYDLNAENTARFGSRQLLKEGDMNAAADKVARTQYDLNAENTARFAAVSGRSLLQRRVGDLSAQNLAAVSDAASQVKQAA
jgi:GH24 family phage-related lysozyme (muramidase)